MEFSLVCLIYIVGVVAAAPAVTKEGTGISETEPSKIVTNEAYTHPKLHLFETQNYTIDKVLDVLKQEHEREHPVDTSSKKNGRCGLYNNHSC